MMEAGDKRGLDGEFQGDRDGQEVDDVEIDVARRALTPTGHGCLLPADWFQQWMAHVGRCGPPPPPVSTAPLLSHVAASVPHARVVSFEAWDYVVAKYGGGPRIVRAPLDPMLSRRRMRQRAVALPSKQSKRALLSARSAIQRSRSLEPSASPSIATANPEPSPPRRLPAQAALPVTITFVAFGKAERSATDSPWALLESVPVDRDSTTPASPLWTVMFVLSAATVASAIPAILAEHALHTSALHFSLWRVASKSNELAPLVLRSTDNAPLMVSDLDGVTIVVAGSEAEQATVARVWAKWCTVRAQRVSPANSLQVTLPAVHLGAFSAEPISGLASLALLEDSVPPCVFLALLRTASSATFSDALVYEVNTAQASAALAWLLRLGLEPANSALLAQLLACMVIELLTRKVPVLGGQAAALSLLPSARRLHLFLLKPKVLSDPETAFGAVYTPCYVLHDSTQALLETMQLSDGRTALQAFMDLIERPAPAVTPVRPRAASHHGGRNPGSPRIPDAGLVDLVSRITAKYAALSQYFAASAAARDDDAAGAARAVLETVTFQKELVTLCALLESLLRDMVHLPLLDTLAAQLPAVLHELAVDVVSSNTYVGVVGVMNAGKSSTISGLVGADVVPSRATAMTVLPTLITHDPTKHEPTLRLPASCVETLRMLVIQLRAALFAPGAAAFEDLDMGASSSLVTELTAPAGTPGAALGWFDSYAGEYTVAGEAAINATLVKVNDIFRAGARAGILDQVVKITSGAASEAPPPQSDLSSSPGPRPLALVDLPQILVCFASLVVGESEGSGEFGGVDEGDVGAFRERGDSSCSSIGISLSDSDDEDEGEEADVPCHAEVEVKIETETEDQVEVESSREAEADVRALLALSGTLSFIDSPGPNEMDMPVLSAFVEGILQQASVVALVLDFASLNGTAEAELQDKVSSVLSVLKQDAFVFVNKFDQRNEASGQDLDEAGVRQYVAQSVTAALASCSVPPSRVFPVSAKYAQLANHARNYARSHPWQVPAAADEPWVEAFARIAYGETWDAPHNYPRMVERGEVEAFRMGTRAVYAASRLEAPLESMLQYCYANATTIALRASLAKLVQHVALPLRARLVDELAVCSTSLASLQTFLVVSEVNHEQINEALGKVLEAGGQIVVSQLDKSLGVFLTQLDNVFTPGGQRLFAMWCSVRSEWVRQLPQAPTSLVVMMEHVFDFETNDEVLGGSSESESENEGSVTQCVLSSGQFVFETKDAALDWLDEVAVLFELALQSARNDMVAELVAVTKPVSVQLKALVEKHLAPLLAQYRIMVSELLDVSVAFPELGLEPDALQTSLELLSSGRGGGSSNDDDNNSEAGHFCQRSELLEERTSRSLGFSWSLKKAVKVKSKSRWCVSKDALQAYFCRQMDGALRELVLAAEQHCASALTAMLASYASAVSDVLASLLSSIQAAADRKLISREASLAEAAAAEDGIWRLNEFWVRAQSLINMLEFDAEIPASSEASLSSLIDLDVLLVPPIHSELCPLSSDYSEVDDVFVDSAITQAV
ncbi:uncharacterized protein AMSG_10125 [Thecamonas trahens ATCC 50062]|uniref:DUSP domain-containing protein n=1 Tax=Thecamonas trahens ATCC 50062 TaxID=461836 RepID=A0A0L0DQ23_THETB|nr:hypothetical protein AMSG_10125 [Thecamonas trahens ATCC 50062]KNC54402.1 hypothetical protein AMSG_10125 [Thecamonas trahens ATCC 50062]|eukprot:XP_013753700.1 hypothetical protein AMSG_10125 [Thecamonas trahens ATCC 50062]